MGNALLAMACTASSGILMLAVTLLAALKLSLNEQGFFFTFLSFGVFVQLADFGMTYAAMQTASHLTVAERETALPGLASQVFRWNFPVTLVSTVVAGLIGCKLFLAIPASGISDISWFGPWVGFLASVCFTQLTKPSLALREGAGKITQVLRLRLYQEWIAGLLCLSALQFEFGLWSLACLSGARALIAATWLLTKGKLKRTGAHYSAKRWLTEAWPFQWKIGLSSLSGFLIFQSFSPVILFEKGPVLAGQFGIAIAMMNMLLALTSAWPMSQAARYGMLSASGQFDEIRCELPKMIKASTALAATLAAGLSASIWVLNATGSRFAERLTDPGTTAIILSAAVMHHIVACFAMPLRAERREPLLLISIVGGMATAVAIWLAAHFGSAREIAVTNLFFAALGIPLAYSLYRTRSRHWANL